MRKIIDETLTNMFTNHLYSKNYMFYAVIVGKCKIVIDNETDFPAAIHFDLDHYVLTINTDRFSKFILVKRMGIIVHECLHIIGKHIQRFKQTGITIDVNIAADCSINQLIDKNHLPDGVITLKYLNELTNKKLQPLQSAEYYYNEIIKSKNENENDENEPDSSHENWEKSKGDSDVQDLTTEKIIQDSIDNTIKMNGNLPKNIQSQLILKKSNNVDWKKTIKNIVASKNSVKIPSLKRPNRRFGDRSDIKGYKKDRKFNILVVLDVSGSVSNKASIQVLNEIKSIHQTFTRLSKLMLVQVDTEAYKPTEFTKKTNTVERKGKGGTNLYPAVIRAKKEKIDYDCLIILTDGFLSEKDINNFVKDKKKVPVIWIITKDGNKANNILNSGICNRFSIVKL